MSRDLKHRVVLQENVHTRTKGVQADSWKTLETVYARIKTLGGGEVIRGAQKESIVSHEIETRYRPNVGGVLEVTSGDPLEITLGVYLEISGSTDMLPRYRILFGSKVFSVHSVVFPYPGTDRTLMRVREVVS